MTHDDLTERVERALHQAEIDYGHTDLEPFDELDESTRGLVTAYANAVIPLVRQDERRRIAEALLSDEVVDAAREGWSAAWKSSNDQADLIEAMMRAALAAIGLGEQEESDE